MLVHMHTVHSRRQNSLELPNVKWIYYTVLNATRCRCCTLNWLFKKGLRLYMRVCVCVFICTNDCKCLYNNRFVNLCMSSPWSSLWPYLYLYFSIPVSPFPTGQSRLLPPRVWVCSRCLPIVASCFLWSDQLVSLWLCKELRGAFS